jgi:hypothetical protein
VANLVGKSFDTPDEKRTPDKTTVDVVDLGEGVKAARFTMEPDGGGRSASSRSSAPIAVKCGTSARSCRVGSMWFMTTGPKPRRVPVTHIASSPVTRPGSSVTTR